MSNPTNDSISFEQEEQNDFNLKELLFKYLAYWKWFLVSLIISLTAAFIYLRYQTPAFKVQSSVLIKDSKSGSGDALLKELDMFSSDKVVDNEIAILKSYTLMEKVVSALNLHVHYFTEGKFKTNELYNESPLNVSILDTVDLIYGPPMKIKIINSQTIELDGNKIALNREVRTSAGLLKFNLTGNNLEIRELTIKITPVQNTAESFANSLQITTGSKMSSVLLLSIEDTKPDRGKDIINKLIEVYNAAGLEDKNKVAANTLRFIEERLILISGDLTAVEKSVENFKSREGITDIGPESQMFLQSVQENDKQLNEVKIQQSVLNSIDQYVRSKKSSTGTVPATLGISDPTLLNLIHSLSELEAKRTQVLKLVKEDNPMVTVLDDQIISTKKDLNENIQNLRNGLAITRQQLENQNNRIASMIKTVPGKERALVDITRQQVIKNNLYIYLLQKREETALSYASAASDSRVINSARSIGRVKPVEKSIYSVFLLFGIVIPFAIIYIRDLMNDTIKSRKDIERATKTPIFGEISFDENTEAMVVSSKGRSIIAEQIRALRTNIAFLSPGKGLQSILFTSSLSGEGKSFISLNLGASLAMTGKKTIILELDMRKPKLHAALNMENHKGLSNYLIGDVDLKNIIHPISDQENYFIITCGPIPPNPAELLLNGRLEELFIELRQEFDYIIIDAPPVGIVTDARILEQQADATMFILRHGFTPKDRLTMLDNIYREKKFKNLNLIFNGIRQGGQYGYSYGYGYGYGYYEQGDGKSNKLKGAIKGFKKKLNGKHIES